MTRRLQKDSEIRFSPRALHDLVAGFDQMAALMAATLGPLQGPIFNALSAGSVEALSDSGTIARRVVEIPDRGRSAGAMLARQLAWRMHELYGDGAATAVVLARQMVHEGQRRIASGVEPITIRDDLELALATALSVIDEIAIPAAELNHLTGAANGIIGDRELGAVLAEIVDILGADASVTFEEFPVPYLDREYVEGAVWRAHPAARDMIPEGREELVLENPLILVADQRLAGVEDVLTALEIAAQEPGRRPLLVIPAKIGDIALTTLIANHTQGMLTAVAALLSGSGPALSDLLGDVATLTQGVVQGVDIGRPAARLRPSDLGSARRATLSRTALTITGGAGDRTAVVERTDLLRRRMTHLSPNSDEWKRLRTRAAQLNGRSAILKLGAHGETERRHRRGQAEKALRVMTGMLAGGVIAGGGVAYLEIAAALRAACGQSRFAGHDQGVDVFVSALEAPFRQIVANGSHVHPPLALTEARRRGSGVGFDVLTGTFVDMREQGIIDSAEVVRGALRLATSTAISLLTTGVIVLPRASRRPLQTRP